MSRWVSLVLVVVGESGCYQGITGDDDDIAGDDDDVAGDDDDSSGGDSDADVDGDTDGDSDADTDADADADGDVELRGLGRTWTEAVGADVDRACEGTPCAGPELRLGEGQWGASCAERSDWELSQVIANCGDVPTPVATTYAVYYGPDGVDAETGATVLAEGLIPARLGAREAVAVHFVLTFEEWSTAVAPRGYLQIDPANRIAECFEGTNGEDAGGITFDCNGEPAP